MSDSADKHEVPPLPFLQRWSQRKHQDQQIGSGPQTTSESSTTDAGATPPAPVREEDLPPIESLHEDSEVSMFLGDSISETLRRQALRKLFHMGKFNVCDGLDDYADDYNVFQTLSDALDSQQQLRSMGKKLTHGVTEHAEDTSKENSEAEQVDTDQETSVPRLDTVAVKDEESKET